MVGGYASTRRSFLIGVSALALACNAVLGLDEKQPGPDPTAQGGTSGTAGGGAGGANGASGGTPSTGGGAGAPEAGSENGGSAGSTTVPGGGSGAAVGGSAGGTVAQSGEGGEAGDVQAGAGGDDGQGGCASGTFDHDADPSTSCQAWKTCAKGEHVVVDGTATSDRTCAPCASETFTSEVNTASCEAWKDCVAGEFVKTAGTLDTDRQCDECGSGSFSTGANADRCTPCDSGSFSASGASECDDWKDCAPGTYVKTDGSVTSDRVCASCPNGMQSLVPNQSECLDPDACQAGTEQTAPATGMTPAMCADCAAGDYCAGGTTPKVACASGTWDHDGNPATACADWTDCLAGSRVLADGSTTVDRTCTSCGASTWNATINAGSCTPWTDCSPGSRINAAGTAISNRTCTPCTAGKYSSAQNAPSCTACSNGTYAASSGATSCATWTDCTWALGGVATAGTATSNAVCGTPSAYRQFGTSSTDSGNAIAVDANGNVYVMGSTSGDLSGVNAGGTDIYVRKFDSGGVAQWTRQLGSSGDESPGAVTVDGSGNVYVCGTTNGALFGTSLGSYDAFIRKYTSTGGVAWSLQFGTSSNDGANSCKVDAAGDVYVCGSTFGNLGGTPVGQTDAYLRKYTSSGSVAWTQQFGTNATDSCTAVTVDSAGGIFMTGAAGTTLFATSAGGSDAYVRKYDSNGSPGWADQFGTASADQPSALGVDPNGNVLVGGITAGALTGSNQGLNDAFGRKFNSSGTAQWTQQFGTSVSDSAPAATMDPSGNSFIVGSTSGTLGSSSFGMLDFYVRKIDSAGTTVSTQQRGTSVDENAMGAATDSSGNLYLVGRTGGTLGASTAGGLDVYVLQITP